MFCNETIAVPNIQAGKVIALGTSAAKPTTLVPDIAPIATTISGYDWQAWQGIVAPAATPKDIVAKLAGELQKIQASADFKEQLVKFGMEPFAPQSPEQFAAMIAVEQPRWAKAIKDSGAKVDCQFRGSAWRVLSSMYIHIALPRRGSRRGKTPVATATR